MQGLSHEDQMIIIPTMLNVEYSIGAQQQIQIVDSFPLAPFIADFSKICIR